MRTESFEALPSANFKPFEELSRFMNNVTSADEVDRVKTLSFTVSQDVLKQDQSARIDRAKRDIADFLFANGLVSMKTLYKSGALVRQTFELHVVPPS